MPKFTAVYSEPEYYTYSVEAPTREAAMIYVKGGQNKPEWTVSPGDGANIAFASLDDIAEGRLHECRHLAKVDATGALIKIVDLEE